MSYDQFVVFVIVVGIIASLFLAWGQKKNSRKLIAIGQAELYLIIYMACCEIIGNTATLIVLFVVLAIFLLYKLATKLIDPK